MSKTKKIAALSCIVFTNNHNEYYALCSCCKYNAMLYVGWRYLSQSSPVVCCMLVDHTWARRRLLYVVCWLIILEPDVACCMLYVGWRYLSHTSPVVCWLTILESDVACCMLVDHTWARRRLLYQNQNQRIRIVLFGLITDPGDLC